MQFEGKPGQDNVRREKYLLLNAKQQQIAGKDRYDQMVFPGTKLTMSMILSLIETLAQYCPRPGCNARGTRTSESSSFYKWYVMSGGLWREGGALEIRLILSSPKCDLSFDAFEPELSRITPLPESQDEDDLQRLDTEVPARNRPETILQEQREEPSERHKEHKNNNKMMQQHQRGSQRASNIKAREDAQSKELHELGVFKRVHILPVQFDQTIAHTWVAEVMGQTRQKTFLGKAMLSGGRYKYPKCLYFRRATEIDEKTLAQCVTVEVTSDQSRMA